MQAFPRRRAEASLHQTLHPAIGASRFAEHRIEISTSTLLTVVDE
jgi:hypothetical protein